MENFEKLGVFYLGKIIDPTDKDAPEQLLLYDSKNFTTHAVCLGMTGSGKTGLGITILEEAAMDKIPSIVIDPKGDLGNLQLTFPNLSPDEFLPWIDEGEAERKGMDPKTYSEFIAKTWKEGLAKWGETSERIKNLRNSVDIKIYTPASKAGIPLSILSSFAAPPKEVILDSGLMRERILSITSSVLGLIGINADPIRSREHILISTILDNAWNNGTDLNIESLIQQVQKPPFDKVGVLDVDTFFPAKDRMALSISLNNLLASPGFKAWMEGEPLDIKKLLYTPEGKPKLSILSIAHLNDSERMFFVTLLLNELISWMRRQPGTSSLRALLYMDEIFGYFPPSAMPPSKMPMLTLLKQARAFGLGIVLATQNPVDLDYKGLANCGTWFIGKLQTERDKSRVIEGLSAASNGELGASGLEKMLASTGNRKFIMRSVYEKDPILFETRWTMSYLRGPLTLTQISKLTDKSNLSNYQQMPDTSPKRYEGSSSKPVIPPGIPELFFNPTQQTSRYKPQVLGIAKLHFIDSKNKIDVWKEVDLVFPVEDSGKTVLWDEGKNIYDMKSLLQSDPLPNKTFTEIPAGLIQEKNYTQFEKLFISALNQNETLTILKAPDLNITSKENESEGEFRSRLTLAVREKRDEQIKKLRDKYTSKITTLTEKVRRAQEKLAKKQHQAGLQKAETLISFGTTVLGALFGKGVTKGTITQAGTSIRRAGKITTDSSNVSSAEDDYKTYQQQLDDLQEQMNQEINAMSSTEDIHSLKLETISIRPRKSDISIEKVGLVWVAE